MSSKLIVAFMLAFALFSLLDAIGVGGGGMGVTRLTAAMTDVSTTVNVVSTQGFLRADIAIVDGESFKYTNITKTSFTGVTRGYDSTEAQSHPLQTKVFSSQADPLNSVLGFNVASTGTTVGPLDVPVFIGRLFTVTIPKLVSWDFVLLTDTTPGQYIRLVLQLISAGFIIYIIIIVVQALGGVLQGIFRW